MKVTKKLSTKSSLLASFGTVSPHKKPENWNYIRKKVEKAIAESNS